MFAHLLALVPPESLAVSLLASGQGAGISTAQKVFTQAKRRAGVDKIGGIHSLRHAYATHQLEAGLPVHELQHLLGHRHLQTTMRYVHWVPSDRQDQARHCDLVGALELDS